MLPSGRKTDGVSLLPYIEQHQHRTACGRGPMPTSSTSLYNQKWERAINDTRYKLIERAAGLKWPVREFFDLQTDPYETKNLLKRSLTSAQRNRLNYLNRAARQAAGQPVTQHA